MIARMWRGWASAGAAQEYQDHYESEVVSHLRDVPGFCGARPLRREEGEEVMFTSITFFTGLDAVRAFAWPAMLLPPRLPTSRPGLLLARGPFSPWAWQTLRPIPGRVTAAAGTMAVTATKSRIARLFTIHSFVALGWSLQIDDAC